MVNITTLTNRQYCVVLDPVDAKGNPQFGRKKLMKGEKSFFLMPGERLEKGIQNIYVLGEDEGLILKAVEGFGDSVSSVTVMLNVVAVFCGCHFILALTLLVRSVVFNSHVMCLCVFTARRNAGIASTVLATAVPSVRLSVCPSHAGIVSKRRHVARCSLHCWIAKCV